MTKEFLKTHTKHVHTFLQDFKSFALKGSMVDLAIGVVIGAAFGKVVSSLVSDIMMPPLGFLMNGIDFSTFTLKLSDGTHPAEIKYGLFITALINFLIVALVIFFVIKAMNKLRLKTEEVKTRDCPECMMSIPVKAKKCGHCGHYLTDK